MTPELFVAAAVGIVGCMPAVPALYKWLSKRMEGVEAGTANMLEAFAGACRIAAHAVMLLGSGRSSPLGRIVLSFTSDFEVRMRPHRRQFTLDLIASLIFLAFISAPLVGMWARVGNCGMRRRTGRWRVSRC